MIGTDLTRILYMEDDLELARLLQKTLQRKGFVVDIAVNGESGLAMLDASRYELLLVDYDMPCLSGIDIIRALSSKNAMPPTIIISGEGNKLVAMEALKLGAADYIIKDEDMKYLDLLPTVIAQVLNRQQMPGERRQMLESFRASEERYYLPALPVQSARAASGTSRTFIRGTGRVLVMDDEDLVRDVLRRSLTSLGYDVVCTRDGMETVTVYEQALKSGRPFDAVIMDLTIPGGMGGKEALLKLRELDPRVKAIVSSGSSDPIMTQFREHGFSGVVSKPYTLKELSVTVHEVIVGSTA